MKNDEIPNLESRVLHLVKNDLWNTNPRTGFLTPTFFKSDQNRGGKSLLFGGVRDSYGRSVIRSVELKRDGTVTPNLEISFDRRGSKEFDSDGTILGHINTVGDKVRLFYVGFRRSERVKFQAFSGLAESDDFGTTFIYQKRIFTRVPTSSNLSESPDIIACHWNNLDIHGDGLALIAIGNGWQNIGSGVFPRYSSYLVQSKAFEIENILAKIPQRKDLYRLGRPRLIQGNFESSNIVVATGGKVDGDYRPYFFEFNKLSFIERFDYRFPIEPGLMTFCKKQIGYPEFFTFPGDDVSFVVFNGDNMGETGAYAIESQI